MKFCSLCKNMLYMNINADDPNTLVYKCRVCDNIEQIPESESICVVNTNLKQSEQKFNLIVNEYTKEDEAIPHIYSLKCPNQSCKSNVENYDKTDIMYIRYDDDNLKYLYMCVECDSVWKTN